MLMFTFYKYHSMFEEANIKNFGDMVLVTNANLMILNKFINGKVTNYKHISKEK